MNDWWTSLPEQTRVLVNRAERAPDNAAGIYLAIQALTERRVPVKEIVCSLAIVLTEAPEHVAVPAGHALLGLLSDDSTETKTAVSEFLNQESHKTDLLEAFRSYDDCPDFGNRQIYVQLILAALGDNPIVRNKRVVFDYPNHNESFHSIVRISRIGGPLAHMALREIFEQSRDNWVRFTAAAYLLRFNDSTGVTFIEEIGRNDTRMSSLSWVIDLATCGNSEIIKVAHRVLDGVQDVGVARRLLELSDKLIAYNASYEVHLSPLQVRLRQILSLDSGGND